MRLSRLYANRPELFGPIDFALDGLNVVLAEIRLPENKLRDTHNLGKSTLGRVIDFCLLAKRDRRMFLFSQSPIFDGFVFFAEIERLDGRFVTVRRSVKDASKVSFKTHSEPRQDFSTLPDSQWDHLDVAFERSKAILDGLLDLSALQPWSYRKGLGYLVRSQDDYGDVFQLDRFASHADWKPYVAHVLGFDSSLVAQQYQKEAELQDKEDELKKARFEFGDEKLDASKIDGMLLLRRQDATKKQKLLDAFDFRMADKEKTDELVEELNAAIVDLNDRRYYLSQNRKKISASLQTREIRFDPAEVQDVFREAGVVLPGQIVKDFEQLVAFNRSISLERRKYLVDEQNEIDSELTVLGGRLDELGLRRADALAFLGSSDVFDKYKELSQEIVGLRADITSLERQRAQLQLIEDLQKALRTLFEETEHSRELVANDVKAKSSDDDSRFSTIRLLFSKIVEDVIDRKALLSVPINSEGHLEFIAEIFDDLGKPTSAGAGHSYQKLLCIAFDMAIVAAYSQDRFPRFLFHDGVFESLDDRKKVNLLRVMREYQSFGVQHIITLIDSDHPAGAQEPFEESEIVLTLHDEGEDGRLFRMPGW